jgi:hypothetical protein
MISESQFKELLSQKTETKNLDCKEFFNWDTAASDEKCALVKDILAFVNTQDGGNIVFGVRDSTLEFVGLGQEDFASFDTTKVNDFLQKYTDPPASCEVQKLSVDGLSFVVISVPEFKDIPIICKKAANSSKDSSKVILKGGGLYIRTEKATSVLVPTSEEMRDLMNRAVLKRGDQLLSTIEALLKGKSPPKSQDLPRYANEIENAQQYFRESLPVDFEKHGYWQLTATPDKYVGERISTITTVLKYLSESEVMLRGWNFPHTDRETKSNFEEGRQSYTVFHRYLEAYRAYQSGLFIWRGGYREEAPEFVAEHGKALSFVNVVYEITEMFVFLKRYYERFAENASVHVSIELSDIKDRSLVATQWDMLPFFENYTSKVPRLLIEKDIAVSELRASAEELAITVIQKILEVFNWNNPDPSMIRGWQQGLLSRTLRWEAPK